MGRKTGKGKIDCRMARELFFDVSEKALDAAEIAALRAHEASCEECRSRFEEWAPLRSALRSPGLKVAPPPGFAAGVMARIAEAAPEAGAAAKTAPGSRLLGYLKHSAWGKGVAAAVLVALVTGSVSLATRLSGREIARTVPKPEKTIAAQDQRKPGNAAAPRSQAAEGRSQDLRPAATKPTPTPSSGKAVKEPVTGSTGTAARVAAGNSGGNNGSDQKVFLNKTRFITTSMLKVRVGNLEQARSAALNLARSEDARLQSEYTTQNQGRQTIILRLTVPNEQAQPFVNRLAELGTVAAQEVSRKDITASFASTLKEYQSLKAEQAAAPEGEKERLDDQIAFLEKQLQSWDEESNKQVVILILEEQ